MSSRSISWLFRRSGCVYFPKAKCNSLLLTLLRCSSGSSGESKYPPYVKARHSIIYELTPKEKPLYSILVDRGVGSLEHVRHVISKGVVVVNGRDTRSSNKKWLTDVEIVVDGIHFPPVPVLAVYHKPVGVHCTTDDPWCRDSLKELLPRWPFLQAMHPVGRLDTDTSGLLLFSRSGLATKALLDPETALEREYVAVVMGTVNAKELREKLTAGITTKEGKFQGILSRYEYIEESSRLNEIKRMIKVMETQRVTKILQKRRVYLGQEEYNADELPAAIDEFLAADSIYNSATEVQIVVTEGKHRMVRRMLHNAGHTVVSLHRIRYGQTTIAGCDEGCARATTEEESRWFLDWAAQLDASVKAKVDRRHDFGKGGDLPLENEAKAAVAFARNEAIAILTKMRKERKNYLERERLLWPENHLVVEEGEDGPVEIIVKASDVRADTVKRMLAERLAEYAATREAPLSNRALKLATKAVNKVILFDKKEEKKWVRLRKKKLIKKK